MSKGMFMLVSGIGGMLVCMVLAVMVIRSWVKFLQAGKTLVYTDEAVSFSENSNLKETEMMSSVNSTSLMSTSVKDTEYLHVDD